MKSATIENGQFLIRFLGDDFTKALRVVKLLDGREYIKNKQCWYAPYNDTNYKLLKDNGFNPPEKPIEKNITLPIIDITLFPKYRKFQIVGIQFLESVKGIGLLADDMGIGKSAQSIGYAKLHKNIRPILVICPASIKLNWKNEITKWSGEDSYVLSGEKPDPVIPRNYNWYIINYDILAYGVYDDKSVKKKLIDIKGWVDRLSELNIKGIIIDECQYLSGQTIRYKAVVKAKKLLSPKMFIALSGTPMRNCPANFYNILNLLKPELFPNRWKYLFRYCNPKNNGFGWQFIGATNVEELHNKVKGFMIRRTKEEVLTELPHKQKIIVPMELNKVEEKEYLEATKEFIEWLKGYTGKNALQAQEQIEKLKQLAYLAKRNSVIQWIKDYLNTDNKLVVFTYHKNALQDIYSQFKTISVTLDGSTPNKVRQENIDKFQNDKKVRLLIGQIQAAGIGITLTAANACAFSEFGYSPFDHDQAEDRINRIGQKADSITAYYLLNEESIELDMVDMLNNKYENVNRVLDGKSKGDFFTKEGFASGIIKKYKNHNR